MHEDVGRRHPLQHQAGRLFACRLHVVPEMHVHQRVHRSQRLRLPVEALQTEALRGGVGQPVDEALPHGGEPRLSFPSRRSGLLPHLDINHAEAVAAVTEVPQHKQLHWRRVICAAFFYDLHDSSVLEHESEQGVQAATAHLLQQATSFVKTDLVHRAAEVFADPVRRGATYGWHRKPDVEEGRGAAGHAQPLRGRVEHAWLHV
mmetsp:Transcript_109905/g.309988  ORF Transcript_109905/g.309988 Transcript_109905/m.309988 type:complete len:204 (+) Transcript_109905:1038-1649(+)